MNLIGEPNNSFAAPGWTVSWAARTDVGAVREINQDSVVVGPFLLAVADGMGGHEAGEVASAAVSTRLFPLVDAPVKMDELVAGLRQAANDLEVAEAYDAGTTVTGIALPTGDALEIDVFNIGDSRVYLYQGGTLRRVTRDDSLVQDMVDTGQLSEEEAENHPLGNVVTRSVGLLEDPVPAVTRLQIDGSARFLICSDGLTKELSDRELVGYLEDSSAETVADELLAAALHAGARDNVTIIVADVSTVAAS